MSLIQTHVQILHASISFILLYIKQNTLSNYWYVVWIRKKILHSIQIKKIHQRQEPIDTPSAGISPCVSCLLVSSKWCEIENVKKCCCFTYSSQNCLFRQPKSDRVITWFISPNNCQRQKKPNGVHGLIRGLEVYHILPLTSKIQVKNAPQSRTLWNPQL